MNDALLSKIKKCLALAKSSNEHEAAAALAKARELMEEHGVSMADIAMSEIGEASAKGSANQRPPLWETALCLTVRHALGCKVVISAQRLRIYIGGGAAPAIASYAFTVLFRQLKAARKEYIRKHLRRCRPGRQRQRADIFCEAWALSVYTKVKALMPAAIIPEAANRYIEKRFGNLAPIDSRTASLKGGRLDMDYWRGHDAGRAVDLAHGVGAGAERLRIA
ncbi:DUF2786 domain-containing protein [Sphingobium sp.]|uniref:DUF2786 domain-containing protein n=1 Tax=Sphingobium sp. TaxID=1912891 RepID=UPI0026087F21|nr:DUF2786 domain-containing protein [Sphingobium sp.]